MVGTASVESQVRIPSFAMRHWEAGALPTPHILDATWWFADETLVMFEAEIERFGGKTVCLGTPSVALRAWQRGVQNVLLVDRDPLLYQLLSNRGYANILTADLQRTCPLVSKADLVVADPPWYESDIKAFLAAAHVSAKVGAEILISVPPLSVRPTIQEERDRIFDDAEEMGLAFKRLEVGRTRYICPPFEHNVLRACGDTSFSEWRTGDLARLQVLRQRQTSEDQIFADREWDEVCLVHTRLRILRALGNVSASPRLQSMGWREDIFPSCSYRHPLREQVAVWTSGNRAYFCQNPRGLFEIAHALEASTMAELQRKINLLKSRASHEDCSVAEQLAELVEREERDYEAIRGLYV